VGGNPKLRTSLRVSLEEEDFLGLKLGISCLLQSYQAYGKYLRKIPNKKVLVPQNET
jgi:hypothetical protein